MPDIQNISTIQSEVNQNENPSDLQQSSQKSSKTLWYLLAGTAVLILLGVVIFLSQKGTNKQPASGLQALPGANQPTPAKPRSKAPGIVTNVVTAKAVDPKTGIALTPSTVFLTTDKTIYLVVSVAAPKIGTKIEYSRYLNGKFLDNKSIAILKSNMTNVGFDWTLKKTGATHLAGEYRVKVYTNGVFEKKTTYTVQ